MEKDGSRRDHIFERKLEEELIVPSDMQSSHCVHDGTYKCGGCSQELRSICQLHEHILKEFLLGSYLYDHETKTAYPKQVSVSAQTQTDDSLMLDILKKDAIEDLDVNQQDDEENGEHKAERKRKRDKRNEETCFEVVSKKKAKFKSNKILKTEEVQSAYGEDETESNLLGKTDDIPENSSELVYIKEETLDYNYDESTDDNLDNFCVLEKEVQNVDEHMEDKQHKSKAKKKVKKKSKAGVRKNKVRNYVKEKAVDTGIRKNKKIKADIEVKFENTEQVLNEDLSLANSTSDVKKRGRPKTKAEAFTCEHCDSVFYGEKRYNVHLRSVHKSIYPFSCKQCNSKPFKNQKDYQDHKEQHPKQSFHCDLCGKELKSREGLRLHELIHSGEKPYCCDKCDYKGRTSTQLRQHMYIHTDSKTEQCEHCGKAFFTKGKLKEHLRYCRKENNHHCPYCQKGFPTASGLRKHILMHTGERAFICDVCGFATFRITLLNSHMRTHTGEKPHKCKECGAKLATRGTLMLHLRTHTHEKPYVCSYCSKAFTSKWNHKTHLRQHTGETPYKCDICGQGFKQNVLRKSHMRSHLESTSTEQNTLALPEPASELHVSMDTDTNEHIVNNHLDSAEALEPVNFSDRRLEPDKLHLNSFVYDRSNSGDILNQALQSEDLHPLDLKLHYTSASDIKNVYNNSVINSHQLQPSAFEIMNYQDMKHV